MGHRIRVVPLPPPRSANACESAGGQRIAMAIMARRTVRANRPRDDSKQNSAEAGRTWDGARGPRKKHSTHFTAYGSNRRKVFSLATATSLGRTISRHNI